MPFISSRFKNQNYDLRKRQNANYALEKVMKVLNGLGG
jgi:hypothetical protein